MKHVNLSDARANLAELLDEVERGETLVISRDGDLQPAPAPAVDEEQREERQQAIRELIEMRKTAPRATVEEILAWRDEGRRY
jgi:antitoxin (DNA-binding transcriptional repressor) of toxin-antitoxin stability system